MIEWKKDRGACYTLLWLVVIGVLVYLLAPSIRRLWIQSQRNGMAVTMSNLAAQTKEQVGQYIDLTKMMKRKTKEQKMQEGTSNLVQITPEMGDMGDLMDEHLEDRSADSNRDYRD